MARVLSIALLLTLTLVGCGGSNSAQGIVSEIAAVRQEIGAAIDGVTDEASANEAIPKIEADVNKINDLYEKFNAMEKSVAPDALQRLKAQMAGAGIEMEAHKIALAERDKKAFTIVSNALSKFK